MGDNNAVSLMGTLIWVAVVVWIALDVWKSPAPTSKTVIWTVFPMFCNLIGLVLYLVWGRKDAWNGTPGNSGTVI